MNRILAIFHSLISGDFNGVNVYLKSLNQTLPIEKCALIYILHRPAIASKYFPTEIPI